MNFTIDHTKVKTYYSTPNSSKHKQGLGTKKVSSCSKNCSQLYHTQNKTKEKSEIELLPDVLREAKFDEFFILVLIKTHKDGVVTGFRSSLEVEHHFSSPMKKRAFSSRVFEALIC